MTQPMQFQKAERTSVKLKIGVQGPSGSGKTMGALALARSIVPDGKIAVIDSENGSASFYSDDYDFDTLNLAPPYTSARYIDAIHAAIEAGYDMAVIDSISHQWAGTGGILERKDEIDQRGGNSFTNWGPFTKEHERFKARLLEAPIHIIATLRTKQEYSLDKDDRGKAAPKKMGMAPIQREGFEYEFGIVFELQMDHRAKVSKDRTDLFASNGDLLYDLKDPKLGKQIRQWLKTGKPAPVAEKITDESIAALTLDEARLVLIPVGRSAGLPLDGLSTGALRNMHTWLVQQLQESPENRGWERAAHAISLIVTGRANGSPMPAPGKVADALAVRDGGSPVDAEAAAAEIGEPVELPF